MVDEGNALDLMCLDINKAFVNDIGHCSIITQEC